MEVTLEQETGQKLHKMLSELANFMALYEQSEDRFTQQKKDIENQVNTVKKDLEEELEKIKKATNDIREVMDAAGAARWRVSAEKALKSGEEHLRSIKEATNVYKKLAEDSINRLEHVSIATEKRVNNALSQLREDNTEVLDEFRRHAEEVYISLQNASTNSINYLKKLIKWLRFDRIGIAVIAGLLSAFLTSAYVNAEWPWESHAQTTQQRMVGKTLMTVWPTLSKQKQAEINQILGRTS